MQSNDTFVAALQSWIEVFMRRSMRNFIRYSKDSGLSMSQIGALFHIYRGASGVSDLGDRLGITSAATSQMLERLVQQGLIIRSEDPNDRRVKQIVLTTKGNRVLQESMHARQGWLNDLGKTLSPEEQEQVAQALHLLSEKAKQLDRPVELER